MFDNRKSTHYLTRGLAVFGAGAFALHAWRLGLTLLGTAKRFHIRRDAMPSNDSDEFRSYLSALCDSQVHSGNRISVLRNGNEFYAAELDAIRTAEHTINLEAYAFLEGELTRELLDAVIERARAGVRVRMVVDAIGSWATRTSYFDALRAAGGRFAWYHPVNSREWPYLNNRTHRKLLVIDGRHGFIGGAGFADHWLKPTRHGPRWRDTVLQTEGPIVAALNAVFAENWLETTGEILAGSGEFRFSPIDGAVPAMVVSSTPRSGGTRARVLYQILIESATKSLHITTPYFVPDRSARDAMIQAAERGVDVKVLTAGPHNDHAMTRYVSRAYDAKLARAGASIYEYQPSMIHAKLMTIDGLWTVAGSANFDHRSFDLNDEVNIIIADSGIASQAEQDFSCDLRESIQLTPHRLKNEDLSTRLVGDLSWVVRREE